MKVHDQSEENGTMKAFGGYKRLLLTTAVLSHIPSTVESFHVIHSSYLSSLSHSIPQNNPPSPSNQDELVETQKNQGDFEEASPQQALSYIDSLSPTRTTTAADHPQTHHTQHRRPIMAGNWKLNPKTYAEASKLLKLLAGDFMNHRNTHNAASVPPEVVVFPPFPYLSTALDVLEGSGIQVGAQNVGTQQEGAYTGEVAASMVRSLGCNYVLLGHSERRAIYKESDSVINQKVHTCLKEPNLKVILCVGETEEEYESNLLNSVVDMQIKKGLMGVSADDLSRIVIAYEPGKYIPLPPLGRTFE